MPLVIPVLNPQVSFGRHTAAGDAFGLLGYFLAPFGMDVKRAPFGEGDKEDVRYHALFAGVGVRM